MKGRGRCWRRGRRQFLWPRSPGAHRMSEYPSSPLRLGTRASALARWQAAWVAARLQERGVAVELVPITKQGDVKTGPLGQIGGQGLFTKEIQRALLDGEIDLAVHSCKDLPTAPVEGLVI